MKFSTIVLTIATAGSIVAAQPHRHQHRHNAKRVASPVADVAGPTVTQYVGSDGQPMSNEDVQRGLRDGTLVLVNDQPVPAPVQPQQFYEKSDDSGDSPDLPDSPYSPPPAPSSPASYTDPNPVSGSDSGSESSSDGSGADRDFPDGQIDCSTFPSEYGAVEVDWVGLGGWAGLQKPGSSSGCYDHIVTAEKGPCSEGMFCSYACPTGYSKAQWPTTQGCTKQSIGGLLCQNGKLSLTNPAFKTLCVKGTGGVSVQNKVGNEVAVCRTDYPGTEGEYIPATHDFSNESYDLTCPNANKFYEWDNKKTSAQYYVNPAGVAKKEACTWSKVGSNRGNWAPVNLGVHMLDGQKWLGIMANFPSNQGQAPLGFKISIEGPGITGDNTCTYSDEQGYCQGQKCTKVVEGQTGAGCTVSAAGDAKYVFSY
ncbi:MAG: hypothetical protein M1817_006008 [Caeruleum heppii]|nr:MAG: hypothetical protein M1817_006008 [Caeruleum heppii]